MIPSCVILALLAPMFVALASLWLRRRDSARVVRALDDLRAGRSDGVRELGSSPIRSALDGLVRKQRESEVELNNLLQRHAQSEAVLESMQEGVIAFDTHEKLIAINGAASNLLEHTGASTEIPLLEAIFRTPDLQQLVRQVLQSQNSLDSEVTLFGAGERQVVIYARPLLDHRHLQIGALVVLNDVTRLRRLETIRRDFVSNVSHELRTPITAIQGFEETLKDGAIENPSDARKFIDIISRHVLRLSGIVESLLELARLEEERVTVVAGHVQLKPLIMGTLQLFANEASQRNIVIEVIGEDVAALAHPGLLERALANVLDNALKYSDVGTKVVIGLEVQNHEIVIAVRDQGSGIETTHLERIFERFYRVDRSRSRKIGGTGLGLALVKHIMNALGGKVSVASIPGQGSEFRLHLLR